MGVVSLVLALVPIGSVGLRLIGSPPSPGLGSVLEALTLWSPSLALVLAILALLRIRVSSGRLVGRGYALAGATVAMIVFLGFIGVLGFLFSGD
jgi:hypothetical protein